MRTLMALAVGTALALTPLLARADVCLQSEEGELFRFTKLKPLRTGKVVPLHGVYVVGYASAPFHGSAYKRTDGQAQFGIFVHASVAAGKNFTLEWTSNDGSLSGTATYDNQGVYQPTGSLELSSTDCAAVPLP